MKVKIVAGGDKPMEYTAMDQYWIWLNSIDGLGVKRFYQLLTEYEDARTVWDNITPSMISSLGNQAYQNLLSARTERYLYSLFASLESQNVTALSRLNDNYPSLLTNIYDPPPVLYVKGSLNFSSPKHFAIVGTRTPTYDGRRAATEIASGLSREGVTIVSGMARGIDTCAHQGCLTQNSPTVAILGCGVDIIYPPENASLYNDILEKGGSIISEYRLGTPPIGQHFPARNRIISGMCPGTLIVEAAKGSGAMITANNALGQDRDVFIVPGSIYSKLSSEPNRLLLEGAYPVLSEWEILEHYNWASRPSRAIPSGKPIELTDDERSIVEPLQAETLSFDELSQKTEILPAKLNSLLTMLELRGIIDKVPGGTYRAKGSLLLRA